MGIFSNRCEALVNPETGKALFGEALEKARQDPQWPRCGHSVKKSAKFCSKCGAPAPGGWVRCPVCGQWAGNDSQFCPHCNTPLYPDERAASAGGVWQKTPDVFAQRLEVQNVKDTEIRVQAGTAAILLDAGDVKDVLEAGEYKLEGLARKINWFNNPPPRSVILLDAGEIALPRACSNSCPSRLVRPFNHFILFHPLLLLPSVFPSLRVFSNKSVLCIRWPKYCSFSFSIRPSNEYSGLISFRIEWLDLLEVSQGNLKSLLQHHSSQASILHHSAFFMAQLSSHT